MATDENVSHSPQPRRIQHITAGIILVCLVPLIGSFARDHCVSGILSFGCLVWSAGVMLSLSFGLGLIFVRNTFRALWRRIRRSLLKDSSVIGGIAILMVGSGAAGYALNSSALEHCWQSIFACLFYSLLSIVCWVGVAACIAILYFGLLHHPILQTLAESQRHPRLRHHEDE